MMIYDWSREQVENNGSKVAVTLNEEHITYAELESESNRLAGQLIEDGLTPGERVGLFMEKKPKTLVAMLGISKAGGVYVPMDYNSPPERVLKVIKSSAPSLIFVDDSTIHHFQDLLHVDGDVSLTPWVWWSESDIKYADDTPPTFSYTDVHDQPNIPHKVVRNPDTAAHILFTSGSTGEPKGVVITHKNIHSFISWAVPFFDMKAGEHVSCHSPLHFDLSTFDIYGAFAAGCRLFLVPSNISLDPKKLADFILHNKLDQWFSVPSALSYLSKFKAIPQGGFPHLKRLIWCGEVFPLPALTYWMKNLESVEFTNLYGPTEATIASSYFTVDEIPDEHTKIPIGTPCEGEDLLVLDDDLKEVEDGEIADLYIAGEGLSPGYWQDNIKTDSVFIRYKNSDGEKERIYKTGDLASVKNGLFYFHGRSDYQIKSRGYRIELGEIEVALGENDMLREYAVVPIKKNGFEGTAIGCAYVGKELKNGALAPLIKEKLRGLVPAYMMPHFWQEYELLPRNGNGKIDRKKLAENFEGNFVQITNINNQEMSYERNDKHS